MTKFSIENFGCRATEADAAALRHGLSAKGLVAEPDHARADFVVLNTCTVTAAADAQAREVIRKIHRLNPSARIIVTGCYAQRAPEELAALEGVTWVIGNSHQAEIPNVASEFVGGTAASGVQTSASDFLPLSRLDPGSMSPGRGPAKILAGDIFEQSAVQVAPATLMAGDRTRPILKIQDGCNNRCAYCVIPFVRGRSRSLSPDTVVAEVKELVAAGASEIVLSGINLGSYGRDLAGRVSLLPVVRRILDETPIGRLRFSSIEPQDITEDFVGLVASSDRLARHFHVPLQSGSNRVLRAMHRWYRAEHYGERIKLIRRLIPDAAIGADVIVGFPGETGEDFQATAELIDQLPFTYLHVFSFSVRPGTQAAKWNADVAPSIIRERARALRALGLEKATSFRSSQAGRFSRALTLARGGEEWTEGLTSNYLKVRIAGRFPANEWHTVLINGTATEVRGETGSGLENDLSKSEIAAVSDRKGDIVHP